MKIAAVDIGSNAARFQIDHVLHNNEKPFFKKVEYLRFPLRLGQDVFTIGQIGPDREILLTKFLHACKLLMELHEVAAYDICATSAMREATNAAGIIERIQAKLGLTINVIDGIREADLISRVIVQFIDHKSYLHIDVGGGSTELNLYHQRQKIASQSFEIGSVRHLQQQDRNAWQPIKVWLDGHITRVPQPITAVGTGGNIAKLYELATHKQNLVVRREEVGRIRHLLAGYTVEERINLLKLNPDRADVIVPAADIYLKVMEWAGAERIRVPDIGLIDGIMQEVYERGREFISR